MLKYLLSLSLLLLSALANTQNFSGLLNKKLTKSDDLGSVIEEGLGSLFGNKVKGDIDSVIVIHDAEKKLRVKIYYKEYLNGFFSVSCMSGSRVKQTEIIPFKFSQAAKASPVECMLDMDAAVPANNTFESVYLRIDVGKKENGAGSVKIFMLNKQWQSTINNVNIVIEAPLTAIGKAASLTNEVRDYTPLKTIKFDQSLYLKPNSEVIRASRPGGGGSYRPRYIISPFTATDAEISGTWSNTDNNTSGITKFIVTDNNKIQVFGRCSPQDCDWGNTPLTVVNATTHRAVYDKSFKTSTLTLSVTDNSNITLSNYTLFKDGRPAQNAVYTFRKNLMMVYLATPIYTLSEFAVAKPPVAGPVDKTAKGPDKSAQIYLLDGLSADVDFKRPQDISNININVFADKNINSGIYYMLPADYHLKWESKTEPEKGYDFRILYGTQRSEGEEASLDAPVRMSASLTAGIGTRERNFVKELLKGWRPDFVDVRFLPLRENPQFTFQNTLGSQYNIPESNISVERITDLASDIKVAWHTNAETKDFIQAALTSREGISASVILKPEDESIIDQQIPASINLADMRTLGKMTLEPTAWRTQKWRNQTPYPLKLKYIHILKKQVSGTKPIIYSWSLNNVLVPSQSQVNFESSRIPAWIDTDPSAVMWVEYSVEECLSCEQKVMDAVTGGVSGTKTQQVKFVIPPAVFDTLKASYFSIVIRGKQGDPKGIEVKEFEAIRINKETGTGSAGPLFIPTGGSLEFEYKITVASTDGDFYPARDWVLSTEKELLLGKTKLKEMFRGIIPGIQ